MTTLASSRPPGQGPYGRLSVAAKQAQHRDRMREPAIVCPGCGAQTTVADLLRHVQTTCPGHRPEHTLSRWITWREATARGVPGATLNLWIRRGKVKFDGPRRHRRYLERDVVLMQARSYFRKLK